jgi:hypothetical protein
LFRGQVSPPESAGTIPRPAALELARWTVVHIWEHDEVDTVVNPLLAYADLITKGDRRCTETAQKIFDEYLQDKF